MNLGFDGCSEKQWHYHVTGSCGGGYSWCPYCYIEKITPLVQDKEALQAIRSDAMTTPGAQKFMESIDKKENPTMAAKYRAKIGE